MKPADIPMIYLFRADFSNVRLSPLIVKYLNSIDPNWPDYANGRLTAPKRIKKAMKKLETTVCFMAEVYFVSGNELKEL